jgi:hypothetical protein
MGDWHFGDVLQPCCASDPMAAAGLPHEIVLSIVEADCEDYGSDRVWAMILSYEHPSANSQLIVLPRSLWEVIEIGGGDGVPPT